MTDLKKAKENLAGHTICLCKGGRLIFSEKRGIAPMMGFISDKVDLNGYSVADLVVGKAAAMLFKKCGINAVFAKTLSKKGAEFLERNDIPYEYEVLTEKIINRAGTGICPMESAVADTDDAEAAYLILKEKLNEMKNR